VLRYAAPLVQAFCARRVHLAGARIEVPGELVIRMSVVAGNIRMHRLIDAATDRGGTIVDVGANIGYNTVYAAKRVGPGGRVVAVEPADDNLVVLRRNISANGLANVVIHHAAAGRVHETRDFFLRGDISAVNSLFPDSVYATVTRVAKVRVEPLDDLVPGEADLVKIDVEGAELDVLAGMPRLLRNPGLTLIVEWHPALQEAAGYAADALPRALLAQGFTLDAVSHMSTSRLDGQGIPTVADRLRRARRPVELVGRRAIAEKGGGR
jgi:FkbM family methyltransferase